MIPVKQVLRNDVDPDGDRISLRNVQGRSERGARIRVVRDRIIFYPRDRSGKLDWFDYQIEDSQGNTAVGRITVSVQP